MAHHTTTIYDYVSAEVRQGRVIDVDKCCQKFSAQFPELTWKQIQNEVIEAVCSYGGGAAWGQGKAEGRGGEGSA